jgi:hypothetical protein
MFSIPISVFSIIIQMDKLVFGLRHSDDVDVDDNWNVVLTCIFVVAREKMGIRKNVPFEIFIVLLIKLWIISNEYVKFLE